MNRLKTILYPRRADLAMSVITLIWGFHFVVVKDSLDDFAPLTFNAIRFSLGLPLILLLAWRTPAARHIPRDAWGGIAAIALLGSIGYQVGFVNSMNYTTSTNVALLAATAPTWTALISLGQGRLRPRRGLLIGIVITLGGVVLVVLGRSGEGLALSHDDLIGSAIMLAAALLAAVSTLIGKPTVDRAGSMSVAIWSYTLTAFGLGLLALPDLITLTADDLPLRVWPNLLYSGVLSSVTGFIVWNYALGVLGPTRAAGYNNLTPIVAAAASIMLLGDPVTAALLAGGVLTMAGVILTRRNIFLRPAKIREISES
ncbi:MAG: DMT family transporter [Chloroflexi bacterium]|nr:DMT family transporter [Chloroflexota bacterium]